MDRWGKPDAFARPLRNVVGHRRAYGYGMLLVRPPSGTACRTSPC